MSGTVNGSPGIWPKKENGTTGYASDDSLFGEEPQVRMRVGDMYQARVPAWDEGNVRSPHSKEGMLIWSPCEVLGSDKLESYCKVAKDKHSYNLEQALGMLFWHKHNIAKSLSDMQNFTPMPDEWSMEDKVLFEQAYAFHGKNFRKVQQLIPDKEIGQLVKFYYTWKKSRMKTSLMDKQASQNADKNGNYSDDSMPEDASELDDQTLPNKVETDDGAAEVKHKLPKGIDLSESDLNMMAEHPKGPEGFLEELDQKLIQEKQKIQMVRQECELKIEKLGSVARPPLANGVDAKMNVADVKDETKPVNAQTTKEPV